MANPGIVVSNLVAKGMGSFLEQRNPLYASANHEYVGTFEQQGYATGGDIDLKIPGYPVVQRGLTNTTTPIQDLVIPYTITEQDIYSVTRALDVFEEIFNVLGGSKALTTDSEKAIVDNYSYPAYTSISGDIEGEAADRLKRSAFMTPIDTVEALGSVNTFSAISAIDSMATIMKFPRERCLAMNIRDAQLVSNSLQNMFNESINKVITKGGWFGNTDKGNLCGFDVYRCTELRTHTAGPLNINAYTSPITVASVAADGGSIVLTGVTASTAQLINAGDMISIPSRFLVDRVRKLSVPYRLVVTAANNANGDGAGNVSVTLSHPLIVSGDQQNVDAFPSVGATVKIFPDHNLNFAYVPAGLSVVPLRLPMIHGATNSDNANKLKVPVHVYIQGLVTDLNNVFRISALVGIKALAPYIIAVPSSVT